MSCAAIDGPSPARTGARATLGRPAAGKTGSTNGSKAAWFVGWVPQLASAVWVGKPQPVELRGLTIGGQYFPQVYGGTLPAPLWGQAMSAAVAALPVVDLPPLVSAAPAEVAPQPGAAPAEAAAPAPVAKRGAAPAPVTKRAPTEEPAPQAPAQPTQPPASSAPAPGPDKGGKGGKGKGPG